MSRTKELEALFASGSLPEQKGKRPAIAWCPDCRTKGGSRKANAPRKCKTCSDTGTITRADA